MRFTTTNMLLFAVVVAGSVLAARPSIAQGIGDDARYRACMAQITTDAQSAFDSAVAWGTLGGGIPARHCQAAALLALNLPRDAALRLEGIAQDFAGPPEQRAALFADASQAWLSANELERAEGTLDAALALDGQSTNLWTDRAVVKAARNNLPGAEQDLDAALALDSLNAEAWALRANARRRLGNVAGATTDIERALALNARSTDALLERGLLRAASGNADGARHDWLEILEIAPDTPDADAARSHIEMLDVRKQ